MIPPVPSKCDHCHKKLDKVLVCSRCKAFAYCSPVCQKLHWAAHKFGCSPVLAGELVLARSKPERATIEASMAVLALLGKMFADWRVKNITVGAFSLARRDGHPAPDPTLTSLARQRHLDLLISQHVKTLAAFSLPPAFEIADYPGRVKPYKNNLRHRLVLITRLLLLNLISCVSLNDFGHVLDMLDPTSNSHKNKSSLRRVTGAFDTDPCKRGARLYGPKVLTVPGELSAAEYAAMAPWMAIWAGAHGVVQDIDGWAGLDQIAEQSALFPELLEYVPE